MTETSGMPQTWDGAIDYALNLYTAIEHGKISVWCHWNLADIFRGTHTSSSLALKHYYKFIRPGAVVVESAVEGSESVFATVTRHAVNHTLTVVLVNNGAAATTIRMDGKGMPTQMSQYTSTDGGWWREGGLVQSGSVTLPGRSIVTLTSNNFALAVSAFHPVAGQAEPVSRTSCRTANAWYGLNGSKISLSRQTGAGIFLIDNGKGLVKLAPALYR
jgi:hypothetical protein